MRKNIPYLFSIYIAGAIKIGFTVAVIVFAICMLLDKLGLSLWPKIGVLLLAFDLVRVVWGKSGPIWWFIEILVWRGPMEYGTSPRRAFSLLAIVWAFSIFCVYRFPEQIELSNEFKKQYSSFKMCSKTIEELRSSKIYAPHHQRNGASLTVSRDHQIIFKNCQFPKENAGDFDGEALREAELVHAMMEWKLSDAFFLSVRYHIPMASVDIKSDYTLQDKRKIHDVWLPLTAAEFGGMMKLLNFLLWPIAIALFIRWAIVGQSQ